jgi:hypothetical protein
MERVGVGYAPFCARFRHGAIKAMTMVMARHNPQAS